MHKFAYTNVTPKIKNNNLKEKKNGVAYTHAHAYMSALVPQGSQCYFGLLYIPDVTIGYVTLVVTACAVMNQSHCLQPEV